MADPQLVFGDHMGTDEAVTFNSAFQSFLEDNAALDQSLDAITNCSRHEVDCLRPHENTPVEPHILQKNRTESVLYHPNHECQTTSPRKQMRQLPDLPVHDWNSSPVSFENFFGSGNLMRQNPSRASFSASVACSSHCDVDCQSQCGETGQGVCCDDDDCVEDTCLDEACSGASEPCTDANCGIEPSVAGQSPITDGDKAAAATLASITEQNNSLFTQEPSNTSSAGLSSAQYPQQTMLPECCFDSSMCDDVAMDNGFDINDFVNEWPPQFQLASHILQYHGHDHERSHPRPCIADDPSQVMTTCSLPLHVDDQGSSSISFGYPNHSHQCGFPVQNSCDFANHVLQVHAPFFMASGPFHNLSQQWQTLGQAPGFDPSFGVPVLLQQNNTMTAVTNRQASSSSASPRTNLSGTTLPETPTSIPSPLSFDLDNIPTPSAKCRDSSQSTSAEQKPQSLDRNDIFMCRWMVDGNMCGRNFEDNDELQKHCKEDHLANLKKPAQGFICPWRGCSRSAVFGQKSKLDRHLQTHTGYKPVTCKVCGIKLSAKQSLEQHMRIHTGETPWKCPHPGCGQAFKQQSACTMHMRTHTKEKPLACDICGKRFAESSNLSKHRRIHNIQGSFLCKLCGKDFHRLDQLRRHMGSNHKDRPEVVAEFLNKTKSGRTIKKKGSTSAETIKTLKEWTPEEAFDEIEQQMNDGMDGFDGSEAFGDASFPDASGAMVDGKAGNDEMSQLDAFALS